MTRERALELVRNAIVKQLFIPESDIHLSSTMESLGADSLDITAVIADIECEIDKEINVEQLDHLTVDSLVNLVACY